MTEKLVGLDSRPPSLLERVRLRRRAPLLVALVRALQVGPSVRLIDLGGGTGALTEVLGRGARELVVVDPSGRKVASGRKRRPGITFLEAEAESLPFDPQRFDRVLSTMAYHHFRDPDQVLAEIHRVMAPGGRAVVCDLDPTTPQGRWARWIEQSLLRRAYHFETRDQVAARFRAARFEVTRLDSIGSNYIVTAE